mmetsp:Transcript_12090/g.26731  ORF Transcript_12090/g.26731 Transcript_12090/m.26731 type:complete len:308 (+) Transcript_12090:126-1049(+)
MHGRMFLTQSLQQCVRLFTKAPFNGLFQQRDIRGQLVIKSADPSIGIAVLGTGTEVCPVMIRHSQSFRQLNVLVRPGVPGQWIVPPEVIHHVGVVGELRLGAFLRVMPRALQAFLAPGGGDLQGIARSAGEAVTTETDAFHFLQLLSFRFDNGIPGSLQIVFWYPTIWEDVTRIQVEVFIKIHGGKDPGGMALGSVQAILDDLVKAMAFGFRIIVKMNPGREPRLQVWHQNLLHSVFCSSKGVDEKMFDAMNRVELQPLDQEFQCCAEGGLVEKVNVPNTGHCPVLLHQSSFSSCQNPREVIPLSIL